jgi:hypothetical protein
MAFQFRAGAIGQTLPVIFGRNADIALVGRLAVFKSHFQENQIGNLLQIIAVAYAVIAQHMAETPNLLDDGV